MRMRAIHGVLLATAVVALLLSFPIAAQARCAMCKTGLTNSSEGQRLAKGFNTGILFLLSAPYVIVGAVAFLIFKSQLRRTVLVLTGRRRGLPKRQQSALALRSPP